MTGATRQEVLSTQQAARLCNVDRRTMLRWVKAELLPSYATAGGRYRIRKSDLRRFMVGRGMVLPRELEAGRARVAIIDDDLRHSEALREVVAGYVSGADVRVATDGFAGGVLVAEQRPHLLFLDIVMPGVNGADVCRRIRSNPALRHVAIVVVSAHLDEESRIRLVAQGADACLGRPLESKAVERLLARYLPGPAGAGGREAS